MIRTKDVVFDESIYYDSLEIDVVKLLKSMIKQLIKISRIQEVSRITENKIKIRFRIKSRNKRNSIFKKKRKKVELKDNQKVFIQLLISKSEEILQLSHIEFSATSAKSATSRSLEIVYQSSIEKITAFIQEIRSTIDETIIISQRVSRIKRMKKVVHAMTLKQVKSDEIPTYYIAFSCFIAARNHYFKEKKSTRKSSKSFSIKNKSNRNDILSESTSYDQMLKHSHFSRFKQIIQIEINQLRSINV